MNTKHGVLNKDGLLMIQDKQWKEIAIPIKHPTSLDSLCELALLARLTHLWIWPDLGVTPDVTFFNESCENWDLWPTWTIDEEIAEATGETRQLISATGCKKPKGGQAWINLCWPENSQWTFCDEDLTPRKLLQTINIMEKELGVPIGAGPTTAGTKLLEAANENHKHWLDPPAADLPVEELKLAAKEIIWPGAGAIEIPPGALYLHKIDKNSAYLRACVAAVFGSGTLTHVFHDQGLSEGRVGIWYVIIQSWPLRPGLPPIAREQEGWFTGPMIKLLRDTGHMISVEEGYQFDIPPGQKGAHKILAKWAGDIFDARILFRQAKQKATGEFQRDCYENAEYAMKDIATSTVGLFSSAKLGSESQKLWQAKRQRIWKFRPDWHAQAIGTHAAIMHYNIIRLIEENDVELAMVYMDAIFFFSGREDLTLTGVDMTPDKLGAYKHEWTQPLTPEIRHILASGDAINIKIGMLNDLAEDKE